LGVGGGLFSHAFDDIELAAGPSAVLPLLSSFPFVLEVDGRVRVESAEVKPGLRAQLFWGPMSYNFHSSYSMATGILLAVDRDLDGSLLSFWLGLRIDAVWPAIPFIAGYEWLTWSED
jgi:hypothetical protein